MEYEWDEAKRLANIHKHGLDFLDLAILFDSPHFLGSARMVDGEKRELVIGKVDDVFVTAIFTRRGETVRVISMRKARDGERRRYQDIFG